MYFEGFDLLGFWEESDYAQEAYTEASPTDALIAEIEADLGYRLPEPKRRDSPQHRLPHKISHHMGGRPCGHQRHYGHWAGKAVFPLRQLGQPVYD